jgi:hypothetical protein
LTPGAWTPGSIAHLMEKVTGMDGVHFVAGLDLS